MRKDDEINDPNSCWNKARSDERMFILLTRDLTAPILIRIWILLRILFGKNTKGDSQLLEAEECARLMEEERE